MAKDANEHMVEDRGAQMVNLWDTGPRKPTQPERPATPSGKTGDPVFELAKVEFQDELEQYGKKLADYRKARAEYEKWQETWGGPYEMFNVWSVDADDHLARDPPRYFISSSTRGHAGKANRGLPEGLSPGPGHRRNLERIEAGESDLVRMKQSDPVFGKQELRA